MTEGVSGVEAVACACGFFRILAVGTPNPGGSVGVGAHGVADGVDDYGVEAEGRAEFGRLNCGGLWIGGSGVFPSGQVREDVRFILVEPKGDLSVLAVARENREHGADIGFGTGGGIDKVKKETGIFQTGKDLLEKVFPAERHVGIERPVGDRDETGLFAGLLKATVLEVFRERIRMKLLQLADGAEHQLSIGKLKGESAAGFGAPADEVGFGRVFGEGGVEGGSDRGKGCDGNSQAREAVAHVDGAPPGIHLVEDDLAKAAVPGGGADFGSEFRNGFDASIVLKGMAFTDDGNHLIDKAVKARHDGEVLKVVGAALESLGKFRRVHHQSGIAHGCLGNFLVLFQWAHGLDSALAHLVVIVVHGILGGDLTVGYPA